MGCCFGIIKYLLSIFNIVFLVLGLTLIGLGVYFQNSFDTSNELGYDAITFATNILIAVGAVISFISFCGCCGAIYKSICLLITYASIMCLLATAMIVIAITIFSKINVVKNTAEEYVIESFGTEVFNVIEGSFVCCGTTGPESYLNETSTAIPPSCCVSSESLESNNNTIDSIDESIITNFTCTIQNAAPMGCVTAIGNYVTASASELAISILFVAAFELLGMAAAIYLCRYIKKKEKKLRRHEELAVQNRARQNPMANTFSVQITSGQY